MLTISPENTWRTVGIRHAGFAIPTAIFLIVILAALGAFLVTIGSGQQVGLAQDVNGIRVLQAARTGIEWGTYQVLNTTGTFRTNCNSAGGTNATISNLTGMTGINVFVVCTSAAFTEGATALRSYQIIATACNNATCPNTSPSALYVERRLSTLITN
jgi:MSHA biogenesis protein MshP